LFPYNAARTIFKTIESVQQQSFPDFELIVIDDGSTDQTLELLTTVKDPRIKLFSYENGGVSVARNRGISHATGSLLHFSTLMIYGHKISWSCSLPPCDSML
jgi:glycosyltransferase involved in cell wall biosynthesis